MLTHARDIRYQISCGQTNRKKTSTPVVQTGVNPHMPIAVTAKYKQFTTAAVTDHAVASFSHHTRSAAVQQVCHTGLTTVERVIDFSIFDLGGLPLVQKSPKGETTYYRSTILQNFIALRQPTPEIFVTKYSADTHTHTQTVNDISPACLSACGDKNMTTKRASHPSKTLKHRSYLAIWKR